METKLKLDLDLFDKSIKSEDIDQLKTLFTPIFLNILNFVNSDIDFVLEEYTDDYIDGNDNPIQETQQIKYTASEEVLYKQLISFRKDGIDDIQNLDTITFENFIQIVSNKPELVEFIFNDIPSNKIQLNILRLLC